MITFADYGKHDATGLAELVHRGEVTPTELVEAALERLAEVNPALNAVIRPLPERARAAAADPALPDGPFRGVPFVMKDLESSLAGVPKSSASRFYGEWAPDTTAELAERWMRAGVVILGKSNCPELGLVPTTEPERWGPTRNPWDLSRTPGGSSGGTAAAVASGIVPLGSGGDGGGSIRIPASCCGLFGLKPTRGRTPAGPDQAEAWNGCAIQHVLARSVRDSAAMLDATAGWYPGDADYLPPPARPFAAEATRDPGRLRVAFTTTPFLPATVHPDCVDAVREAAALLAGLGHQVEEAAPPLDGAAFAQAFLVMLGGNTWAAIHEAEQAVGRTARPRDFESLTWLSRQLGRAFHAGHYVAAVRRLQALVRPFHQFFDRYDVLLTPTLAEPPPRLGFMKKPGLMGMAESLIARLPPTPLHRADAVLEEASRDAFAFIPFTPVMNVTGQPSASVPLHWTDKGLPVGVMLTAAFAREDTLFRLAGQLEAERPWAARLPVGGGPP